MSRKNNYIGADKGFQKSIYNHQLPDSKRRVKINHAKSRAYSFFHPKKEVGSDGAAWEMLRAGKL